MSNRVNWGKEIIGEGIPTYIVAEIGINHNGDINIAKQLIDIAVSANCNATSHVKHPGESCPTLTTDTRWNLGKKSTAK